jgi:gelsolin
MQKQKLYDWKDSNVALIGSSDDRELRLKASQSEEAWKSAGIKEGLQIWRIE